MDATVMVLTANTKAFIDCVEMDRLRLLQPDHKTAVLLDQHGLCFHTLRFPASVKLITGLNSKPIMKGLGAKCLQDHLYSDRLCF